MHDLMVKARVLEERLIPMYKQGDGYFWIGGPGEEAFNVPLGLLVNKGQGPAYDYLHLHYRAAATLLAMGADPVDALRQMKNTATDPYSGGRNFAGHYSKRAVERRAGQLAHRGAVLDGARARRWRRSATGGDGITIVTGGDAGTAEGDFATCLVWSSRPGQRAAAASSSSPTTSGASRRRPATQHGEKQHRRSRQGLRHAHGRRSTATTRGGATASCKEAMDYVRTERKPFLLEAHGVAPLRALVGARARTSSPTRSTASRSFEEKLEERGVLDARARWTQLRERCDRGAAEARKRVRDEPQPGAGDASANTRLRRSGNGARWRPWCRPIRMALHVGEEHLGVTDIFGEDVGPPLGGVFTATQGLKTAWNSPLDERGIVGTAIGLALAGQRPVAEIQFCDYVFNTIDLLKLAGNTCWSSNGDWNLPMVVMTPVGSGIRGSIYHSHSFDAKATRIPGWKIVMPSNPLDAYGLMLSAMPGPEPGDVPGAQGAPARQGGDERIPGEPDDEQALSQDDRRAARRPHGVEAAVAGAASRTSSRSARRGWCREGDHVTRRQLRPHAAHVRPGGRRAWRDEGIERRGHRPALALAVRLGGDHAPA